MLGVSTGNVDQGVYLTKLTSSATDGLLDRRRVGHVQVHREVRALTALRELRHHVMRSTLVDVQDGDPRAFVRKSNSAGAADAMSATSHQRCRAVEAPTLL